MENYMKDHRSFRDIMKEELTRTRDYLFSLPEQFGQDPGAELGPRQVPGPVISKDGKAPRDLEIRLLNKPPSIDPGAGSGSGSAVDRTDRSATMMILFCTETAVRGR